MSKPHIPQPHIQRPGNAPIGRTETVARAQETDQRGFKEALILGMATLAVAAVMLAAPANSTETSEEQLAANLAEFDSQAAPALDLVVPEPLLVGRSASLYPDPMHKLSRTDVLLSGRDLQPQWRLPDALRKVLDRPEGY